MSQPPRSVFRDDCLQGRVAVVTGANGGLGGAIARRLAGMGAQLVLVDLQAVSVPVDLPGAIAIACDIADADAALAMAQQVHETFGRCDVLVNNAGIKTRPVPLEDLPVEDWDKIFAVNVRGAFLCGKYLARMMIAGGVGSIVNIASIGAQVPTRVGAYGATKAALCGLTLQMAVEWGPKGIRANSVSPGMVRTPMSDAFYRDEAQLQKRTDLIPVRRIGVPEDIADTVAYLASDASAYVTGRDIVVDGGFLRTHLISLQANAPLA